jgi:hypothetical protein
VKFGVSVYIPNRNHAATLPAAILSAAREMPVEVVVIDDASTDSSVLVADAASRAYGFVSARVRAEKAACWEQAAAKEFGSFSGTHIIGLSADDELWPGVVQSTMRHQQAAVIFHHYLVRKPGREPHAAVQIPFGSTTSLTPLAACQHLASLAQPCETGVGSAIRHDWLRWLCDLEYWRMGPWADAIGYAAVAAMGGAVYVPQFGAMFTEDDNGYGVTIRNSPDASRYMVECWAFLKRAKVPQDVAEALCRKRGVHA